MRQSLLWDLVPRTIAQWMALLGLIPFAAGAWMQARGQREIRIATMATDQRLGELERRLDELARRSGSVGVEVVVTGDSLPGSDSLRAPVAAPAIGFDSLDDGVRALRAENAALAREFDQLTRLREDLRARKGGLRGPTATANILLALGALVTMAGVLTDIRQFRQQRRRAA
jgi:hypothetical protein